MPNYNYRSNDCIRRSQCQRALPVEPVRNTPEQSLCAEERNSNCCIHDLLHGMPVAMAYVPWQTWKDLYSVEKALCRGTIFEELDKPFMGIGGCCK